MWDLPRPGLEPVFSALAGRFSTTAPPGKPLTHALSESIAGSFVSLNRSPFHGIPRFFHSLFEDHLGCFQLLTIMSKAEKIACRFYVDVCFQVLWVNPKEHDCWARGEGVCGFVRNRQAVSHGGCDICIPTGAEREFLLLHVLASTLVLILRESFIRYMIGKFFLPLCSFFILLTVSFAEWQFYI